VTKQSNGENLNVATDCHFVTEDQGNAFDSAIFSVARNHRVLV